HLRDSSLKRPSVDLKRRPPKSRPGLIPRKLAPARKAARKDSAVHVSLSSDSLVKQPEPQRIRRGDANMATSMAGCSVTVGTVRGFADAPTRRGGGAPKRTYIGFSRGFCQPCRAQRSERKRQFLPVFAIAVRHCGNAARVTRKSADYRQIRHLSRATPYCGHIPRPILRDPSGVANWG